MSKGTIGPLITCKEFLLDGDGIGDDVLTVSGCGRRLRWLKSKHVKSVCMLSSRLISSLENIKPGMRPRFLRQKIEAKDPEKKIPSTAVKATRRSLKSKLWSVIR